MIEFGGGVRVDLCKDRKIVWVCTGLVGGRLA